jgi:hypothetical protein
VTLLNLYLGVGQGAIHPQHREVMAHQPGRWVYVDKFVPRADIVPMDGASLAVKGDSLGTICASLVLEHFSHCDTRRVLGE